MQYISNYIHIYMTSTLVSKKLAVISDIFSSFSLISTCFYAIYKYEFNNNIIYIYV